MFRKKENILKTLIVIKDTLSNNLSLVFSYVATAGALKREWKNLGTYKGYIRIFGFETRDFWWHPRLGTHLIDGTWDPTGGSKTQPPYRRCDPRPCILKVRSRARIMQVGPEIQIKRILRNLGPTNYNLSDPWSNLLEIESE